jgi:drug/metabolite transporter (DMT)-like permease
MSRPQALFSMILAAMLWSIAGVVTRHLDSTPGFEVTFWRSAFNGLFFIIILPLLNGPSFLVKIVHAPRIIWISGICWSIMFTAFMLALTLTTVANVLIVMALSPLITALSARLFLQHRLTITTWMAIVVAGFGIAWMFIYSENAAFSAIGSMVAFGVPLASALNFTLLQSVATNKKKEAIKSPVKPDRDMLQSVLIGAVLSSLVTLPMSLPFKASLHDLGLLSLLGVFQLAIPCLLVVYSSRKLSAPEISLLSLLEVIFGVVWAWLWAGEKLSANTLGGGLLVLSALILNELFQIIRQNRAKKILINP